MDDFKIEFFEKLDGTKPAQEFLLSLEPKMRAKLIKTIELLEKNGNTLREPYSEYLRDDIFEIRAKVGSDITRVLYFFMVGRKIILTNGLVKKTSKTPKGEIELAIKYRKEYIARGG